jgi:hypothetical protein
MLKGNALHPPQFTAGLLAYRLFTLEGMSVSGFTLRANNLKKCLDSVA